MTKEDRNQKEWFVVYMDQYETKEEAARQGNRLIKEGIIRNFFAFPIEVKEEPQLKPKELPAPKSTFDLGLNPSFNYEVSQNYFEKEKIYSLRIQWESAKGPDPVSEK
jgi:hypothetical protein